MRKIFTLLLLLAGFTVSAQQFNNEWINYSQTYYKIKVGKTGLYRIPKSLLDAAGIGAVQVQYFELWRNGERVPFYPSVSSGTLPAGGYIEFWGERNDGKPDKAMYRVAAYQHTDKISLQSDTAVYFLSTNFNQSGFLINDVFNNVAGNSLPAEPYFMYTAGNYYQGFNPNQGFAAVIGSSLYSSSYDRGELFSSDDIKPGGPLSTTISTLYPYTGGSASSLKLGGIGNALNQRNIQVRLNGSLIKDTTMDFFNDLVTTVPVDNALIGSGAATLQFSNTSAEPTDRMRVSFFELTYPRQFNFGGQSNFKFTLPARSSGYFLQIANFNAGSAQPVLYDLANGERYTGVISSNLVQFALPGTANDRQLVLVSEDGANINTVSSYTTRKFTSYADVANQGNYLVISNPLLYTGSSGNNPVIDYKNYRESTAGGRYKVVVADINELVDQFAFGIKKHPLSIRNFIRYARANFSTKLEFIFLIGRGLNYFDYQRGDRNPTSTYSLYDDLNMVPTFGNPCSDNLLSAEDLSIPVPATPIGRLSVVHGTEIEDYLSKVKEYELAQKNAPNTLAGREWMKNVVHVTGSSDSYLGTVLCNYMDSYRAIIEDTLYGAQVSTFCKETTNPVEQLSSARLSQLFAEGISMLTYFGHSSNTTLEFNIDDPTAYSNQGKYPVFFVNGCNAGNFFTYYPQRFVSNETLSEKFVLAKERGSIGFVASTHLGIVSYLNLYLIGLYEGITQSDFYKPLGEITRNAFQSMMNAAGSYDFYARITAEEMALNGDPALMLNTESKPDYVIEQSLIKVNPAFISLAEKSFDLKVKMVNLGKAVPDSVTLEIKQQYPDGSTAVIYRQRKRGIQFADSVQLTVPIVTQRDKGQHRIIATIDADNNISEIDETNNSSSQTIYIYEEEARPAYPYNYAIIKEANQKLYASTANALSAFRNYIMEFDTTGNFNSPVKIVKTTSSIGGVLEFNTNLTYRDSTVYYWRVAPVPSAGQNYQWSTSSFTYMASTEGYNQSHYFQHLESTTERMSLDTNSKLWKFGLRDNALHIRNCIYNSSSACLADVEFAVAINDNDIFRSACVGNSLIFNVLDSVTLMPWKNTDSLGNSLYRYGSGSASCGPYRLYNFEYSYMTAASRKLMMDFMDSLPSGVYVVVRSIDANNPNSFSATWQGDTTLYGSNKSLYHKLLGAGLVAIDSLNSIRPWAFIYQKGNNGNFRPMFRYGTMSSDKVNFTAIVSTPDTLGYIKSPQFGPAKKWKMAQWGGTSMEQPSADNPSVQIIGVDSNNVETVLYTLDKNTTEFDLSSVDPVLYRYLEFKMRNIDSVTLTPFQLKYWRITYDPVPEGAIAPNLFLVSKDTLDIGEPLKFAVAFKNISNVRFDSLAVKVVVTDRTNTPHTIPFSLLKPLVSGDTVILTVNIDTRSYVGNNNLNVIFNPDNYHQPEHYSFNNFLYKNFYVKSDQTNPTLDVTFDGVHILNKDIVSAKPHIQIKLTDESKYMLLNDTTISTVQVRYPDGSLRTYHFDGDTLRFVPATSGSNNTATIEFAPAFTRQMSADGDEYELIVKGKDVSGNSSGTIAYRIAFRVITKPMISNLLNYPNPFSTSTAFVFTLTGSDVPQNIRIQILTVTGKIVREITMNELGPIHIGRNITDFKWDGTDQYGQKLGNGVYLYRVVTSLNGKRMDKYTSEGDDTDKYFNNGYGKMYLMR